MAIIATLPILVIWALVGRHRLAERLGFLPETPTGTIWIHAASVGEVGVSAILRNIIREIDPDRPVLMTSTTKMGYRRLSKLAGHNDYIAALPLDHPLFIDNALSRVRPDMLIVVETELWPNLIFRTSRKNIPVILANGRISNTTLSWAYRFPRTFAKITGALDIFLMKSNFDADNLFKTGVPEEKILVPGNLKFAGIPGEIAPIDLFRSPVVVFGSVRPKEFAAIAGAIAPVRELFSQALMLIALRHRQTLPELRSVLKKAGLKYALRSEKKEPDENRILIIDTMGELLGFYASSDVAFVGGTLADYGGHNPLEPAYFGKPVLFGPFYGANREAYDALLETGGGRVVRDSGELAREIANLLGDKQLREQTGRFARDAVDRMRQVSEDYKGHLEKYL